MIYCRHYNRDCVKELCSRRKNWENCKDKISEIDDREVDVCELLPCPFCGRMDLVTELNQIDYKWGYVLCGYCGARGPEVRTGCDISTNADWHDDAADEWNERLNKTLSYSK